MKVYIVFEEPWYEGGGSYFGTKEVIGVFLNKADAEALDKTSDKYSMEEHEAS